MYVNSSGTENVSLSLTFLGRKVGRHRSVAPASKQRAWETTTLSPCPEDSVGSSRVCHAPMAVSMLEELPGSVPDLREAATRQQPCPVHNTRLDQDMDTAVVERKALWLKRWEAFRRWIGADRSKDPNRVVQGLSDSLPSNERERNQVMGAEGGMDVKIYIPYESAELCITQIAEDMQAMKTRHQDMVQELEENFMIASRENQERTVQKIRSHYQNKLNALKRILDVYQERVEKKSSQWEERVAALRREKEQLQEEQGSERRRTREEALQWQREKSKMLELFSTRLDLLHSHQASTLQELQMARQEVGKVQEMLMTSQQGAEQQEDPPSEVDQSSGSQGHDEQAEGCSNSELPLEGANARLEELKESLYKREREITELLEAEPPRVPLPPFTILLQAVVEKAHHLCSEVTEARVLLDHMTEVNRTSLVQARKQLDHAQVTLEDHSRIEDSTDPERCEPVSSLALLQDTVRKCEVVQIALDCIRSGASPSPNGCDPASEVEDVLGTGEVHTAEGQSSVGQQLLSLQDQLKQVKEENKKIIENYTSERTMRKKYYNMVENMKGKIRVLCRIRPLSRAEAGQGGAVVLDRLDDYSVTVETARGPREFQFDWVFSAESSQEDVFQDTNKLIQSAIDGYNVCIFAYGQTGSGKTFTMVGDREQRNPGIMPRTFSAMFDIIQENGNRFNFKVSAYMLELYNDRLQDLFVSGPEAQGRRLEIKRNRKGLVFAQGAETKVASSASELFALFQQACANRHISATKMNLESSRSHLIVGITVESRNLTNGSVSCGKLSLVDLAGSERAAKTGAKDDQLKEANSINKSLSALGDVISALSSELPHVPYRNSKLTQVMQDSLGGNAKTLMIVNVSPSDCNLDETLTSLIYATRVKAITNNAQRNVDSKEIALLKEVILKLRTGQPVEEEEV